MIESTCSFFGHRNIKVNRKIKKELHDSIVDLIVNNNVDTFLFGSNSEFDDLCYRTVTAIKKKYPFIKRVYVRAEYQYLSEEFSKYLLKRFEQTYYPDSVINAGKAVYVKRNFEMIDKSKYCIVYFDKKYVPKQLNGLKNNSSNSGTRIAYDYAVKNHRIIVNIFELNKT